MAQKLLGVDGNPILRNGKEVWTSAQSSVLKAVDLGKRELSITGTTEARDRDRDRIKVSGWELENFLKNPVFLWGHDYSSVPLAAARKVVKRRAPLRLDFVFRFPTEIGLYPFADMILGLYDDGIINASSVGFIPIESEPLPPEKGKEDEPEWTRGRLYTKQELLELSGVAVPSNPEALQNSLQEVDAFRSLDGEAQKHFISLMCKGSPVEPESKGDLASWIEDQKKEVQFIDETVSQHFVPGDISEKGDEPTEDPQETEGAPPAGEGILKDSEHPEHGFCFLENHVLVTDSKLFFEKLQEEDNPFYALTGLPIPEKPEDLPPTGDEGEKTLKAGAVLSARNKTKLQRALEYIQEVLASAEAQEEEEVESRHLDALLSPPKGPGSVPPEGNKDKKPAPPGDVHSFLRLSPDQVDGLKRETKNIRDSFPDLFPQ